jgi:hypothetical protein
MEKGIAVRLSGKFDSASFEVVRAGNTAAK